MNFKLDDNMVAQSQENAQFGLAPIFQSNISIIKKAKRRKTPITIKIID